MRPRNRLASVLQTAYRIKNESQDVFIFNIGNKKFFVFLFFDLWN
jgi:hypothetical protein